MKQSHLPETPRHEAPGSAAVNAVRRSKTGPVRRAIAITLAGSISAALIQWAWNVALVRSFGEAEYGRYALAAYLGLVLFALLSLGIKNKVVAEPDGIKRLPAILKLRAVSLVLALAGSVAFGLVIFGSQTSLAFLLLGGGIYAVLSFAEVFQAVLQRERMFGLLSVSRLIRAGALLAGAVIGIVWFSSFAETLALMLLFAIAAMLIAEVRWTRKLFVSAERRPFSRSEMVELIRQRASFSLGTAAVALQPRIGLFLLVIFAGASEPGVFASLILIGMVLMVVSSAISDVVLPSAARAIERGDRPWLLRQARRLSLLALPVLALLSAAAFIYGDSAAIAIFHFNNLQPGVVGWMMIAAAVQFLAYIPGPFTLANSEYAFNSIAVFASLLIPVAAAPWIIPEWGIIGVFAAQAAGFALQGLLLWICLIRVVRSTSLTKTLS